VSHLPALVDGFLTTLALVALSFAGAFALGLVVVVLRVGPLRVLRLVGTGYVETFQNVPLLVWLVLFVFGLPEIGVRFPLFTTAVVVISLYEAAYVAEALRSGVNTVARGQGEAARALGLTFGQALRHVVVPQAARRVVQPLGNIGIALTMNTSLAAVAGVVELTASANRVNLVEALPIPIFVGAGLCYALLAACIGGLAGVLERRLAT
jgi:glutamate transport system permease protein